MRPSGLFSNMPSENKLTLICSLLLAFFLFFLFFLYLTMARVDGAITPQGVMNFIGSVITSLSLVVTFAVAVFALSIFAKARDITQIHHQVMSNNGKLNKSFLALSKSMQALSYYNPVQTPKDENDQTYLDKNHNLLYHLGNFIQLFSSDVSQNKKLNICKDIIGSADQNSELYILEETRKICEQLCKELPDEAKNIDALLIVADRTIADIRERHLLVS